jgi:glutamine cyclotransferase
MKKLHLTSSFPSPSDHLCGLAYENGNLWYSDGKESKIYKLEPETGRILTVYDIPEVNTSLSFDGGYLYQVTGEGYLAGPKNVTKIDPRTGKVIEVIPLGEDSKYIAGIEVKGDTIWVSIEQKARLQKRLLYLNKILWNIEVEPRIAGIVIVGTSIFYCEFNQRLLVEVDLKSGVEIDRYELEGNPTGITWDGENILYNDYTSKMIRKVRP